MFLIPLVRNHKSYSAEIVEDKSAAQEQLKQWFEDLNKSKKIADQIHEETIKEFGETAR